jgi:signal transduction histidine kinase
LTITGLIVLVVILAVVLALGAMLLMRYVVTTRNQKKTIRLSNESNALKAKFISNISAQLEPTLKKLDGTKPEVKALLNFSEHIQILSDVENTDSIELEDTQVQLLCEKLIEEIKPKLADSVSLTLTVPKVDMKIHKEYLTYILRHLLNNAVEYVPSDGKITLELKKRNPHTYQFLITNTGAVIPEEKREDVFKPFLEIKDLTTGDGLGLPICKQMALKMNGDLDIDPAFTKGTRFILNLHV